MSINNIERPRKWLPLFQYDNKNQTDANRRTIIMNKLEHYSGKNYFLSADPRPKLKSCHCLNPLNRDDLKIFMLPFVTSDDGWVNEFLKSVFICKEAFGMLYIFGLEGMRTLVKHLVNHTLPIH